MQKTAVKGVSNFERSMTSWWMATTNKPKLSMNFRDAFIMVVLIVSGIVNKNIPNTTTKPCT